MNAIQFLDWGNGELKPITPIFRGHIEAVEQNKNKATYDHFTSGFSINFQNFEGRFNFKNADWSWFYTNISENQAQFYAFNLDSEQLLVNTEGQKIAYSHVFNGGSIVNFYDADFFIEYDKNIFEKCEVYKSNYSEYSDITFYLKDGLTFKKNIRKTGFYQQTRIKLKEKFLDKRIQEDINLKIIFENN